MEDKKASYRGIAGLPYRADGKEAPLLTKAGDPSTYPVRRAKVHVKIFRFSSGDEAVEKEYSELLSTIVDSTNLQISQDRIEFDKEKGEYVAYVRWIEEWLEAPSSNNEFRGNVFQVV